MPDLDTTDDREKAWAAWTDRLFEQPSPHEAFIAGWGARHPEPTVTRDQIAPLVDYLRSALHDPGCKPWRAKHYPDDPAACRCGLGAARAVLALLQESTENEGESNGIE